MSTLIIDTVTGTILNTEGCYIIDATQLTTAELDVLDNGSEDEVCELGMERGFHILTVLEDNK